MKFFKLFNWIFWIRFVLVGIVGGLIIMYLIDNMLGKGWIAGYTFAIIFSKLHEFVKDMEVK